MALGLQATVISIQPINPYKLQFAANKNKKGPYGCRKETKAKKKRKKNISEKADALP